MNYDYFFTDRYYHVVAKLELRVERRLRKAFELAEPETVLYAIAERIAYLEANHLTVKNDDEYQYLVRMREWLLCGQSLFSLARELLTTDVAIGVLDARVAAQLLPYALLARHEQRSGLGIGVDTAWLYVESFCRDLRLVLTPAQLSAVRSYVRLGCLIGDGENAWVMIWNRREH